MAVNAEEVSIFIPVSPDGGGSPREDVAGALETFKGYNIFTFTKDNYAGYSVEAITPEINGGQLTQYGLCYSPGMSNMEHSGLTHAIFTVNWRKISVALPEVVLSPNSSMDVNPLFSPLSPWRILSMVASPYSEEARYNYGWNHESRFKELLKKNFNFPLLASWGAPAEGNPEAEEVTSMARADELLRRAFAQNERGAQPLYFSEFAPLEPGQLRLWLSGLSGDMTCLAEDNPENPYDGSMEGLEEFTRGLFKTVQEKNRHGYAELLCIDVARSNGYNATKRAKDPGSWVITDMFSPNLATSFKGVITPHHFGLPDLSKGVPEPAPTFQLPS